MYTQPYVYMFIEKKKKGKCYQYSKEKKGCGCFFFYFFKELYPTCFNVLKLALSTHFFRKI